VTELIREFGVAIMTPRDILTQLLEECGYNAEDQEWSSPPGIGWNRLKAAYREVINFPLTFTVAINRDGRVWLSKAIDAHELRVNIYDPGSIEALKEQLIKMKEFHEIYSRQRQAQ
jgi:hypothetical protein